MKKKGFTLIELLAVIVILAIIAFITIPLILNAIDDAKKNAFKDTAYGLIESAELYYSKNQLVNSSQKSISFTFPDASELGYKGDTPKSGTLTINRRGEVSLAISNDKYCIIKKYIESEVKIIENFEECEVDLIDTSGANAPELLNKMIPVKYDGTNWKYVDHTKSWYNYDAKKWANAVVLNGNVTKKVGDIILESDVALWYVWIPRYKYQLFNVSGEIIPEQVIEVQFENGVETTGDAHCTIASNGVETCENAENGNWYTHPAFRFDGKELTGIWVGKFDVSTSDSNCNYYNNATYCDKTLTVTIKPNVRVWHRASILHFYNSIKKISGNYSITNGDSHLMKNLEYGAVTYLKQSNYGLGLTDLVSKEFLVTGGADYKIDVAQSTTGNITGIYATSGISLHIMGNVVSSSGKFDSGDSGLSSVESKYYDPYAYGNSGATYQRGHLGDATKETRAWYSSSNNFPVEGAPFFSRGPLYGYWYDYGSGGYSDATRAVLVKK